MLVVNEYADGDLAHYVKKKLNVWTPALVENCVFQTVVGLLALEKYYNMTHNDLHYGNILVHEVQRGGFWHYKINGIDYYVPNLGYVFILWDLGMADIPGKMRGRPKANETDIGRICDVIRGPLRQVTQGKTTILKDITRLEGQISLNEILLTFFERYRKVQPASKIIDTFNMDIKLSTLKGAHPKEMLKFLVTPKHFSRYASGNSHSSRFSSL